MTYEEAIKLALINPELEDAVFRNMPNNFTKFEQTLYIYSKLCSILNYDPQFLASDQTQGPKQKLHEDINYIKTVTPENADVVCYNFNVIFAKFLDKIGIQDYKFVNHFEKALQFGGHSDFHIHFSPEDIRKHFKYNDNTFIFHGNEDMKNIKVHNNIKSMSIFSNNDYDFFDFASEKIDKIVSLVVTEQQKERKSRQQTNKNIEQIQALEEQYKNIGKLKISVSEQEKLKTFLEQVQTVNLNKYDSLFYIKKMFSNMEFSKNSNSIYTFSILKEQSKENPELYNMVSVFSICNDKEDFYIKITPPNKMENINPKELQKAFDDGKMDYIDYILLSDRKGKAVIPHIISKTAEKEYAINHENRFKSIKELKENLKALRAREIRESELPTEQTEAYKIYKKQLNKKTKKSATLWIDIFNFNKLVIL